jgi:putative ABC transport system ATP-binding protein
MHTQPNQSTSTDIAAHLEDIHKTYMMGSEEVRALDSVTLSFHRGDFWVILGSSGSGKSTMLNLLGCLDRPTKGHYFLSGQDVSELDDDQLSDMRLKHLGFIFQSFNLIPQSTVQENIQLPMYYQGIDQELSSERAIFLADKVGLGDRLNHKPTELSGGQQQRVAVARALSNDPAILLADEPTGNLDSSTSKEIMKILAELNQQGKTILMVTHEEEIAAYANKRMYLKDGKIEQVVTSE